MDHREAGRLDSWKQIAAYLGKSERTVRRWQQTEGLPVHRHVHQQKGSVWSYEHELDAWLVERRESPGLLAAAGRIDDVEEQAVPAAPQQRRPRWSGGLAAAGAVFVAAAMLVWAWVRDVAPAGTPLLESLHLTQLPGSAYGADFSPDLKRIVFFWAAAVQLENGIYVKDVAGGDPIPLATRGRPAYRYSPAWSPDGTTIAYLRRVSAPGRREILTELCLAPVKTAEAHPEDQEHCPIVLSNRQVLWGDNRHLVWTQDGKWILAPLHHEGRDGIYAISPMSGEVRPLSEEALWAQSPALSPNQYRLVYTNGNAEVGSEQLVSQSLTPELQRDGGPKVLRTNRTRVMGLAWDPAGQDLILCDSATGYVGDFEYRLYRMRAEADAVRRLIHAGGCSSVTMRTGTGQEGVLAFGSNSSLTNQLFELKFAPGSTPVAMVHAGRRDYAPALSPDGTHVAFLSNRSGRFSVWISTVAGANLRQMSGSSNVESPPRWSPDGERLVYAASTADGRVGLAVATVKSGKVAVVPMDGENLTSPCWSEDGEWIYYWSGSGFGRVRANGSEREEVMRYERTEYRLRPVYQGGYLYFASKGAPYALGRLHVATRREEVLVESAQTSDFAVTARSLYFVKTARAGRELYRVALGGAPGTASAELVATIPVTEQVPLPLGGFAVSRDESKVVYSMPSGQSLQLQYIPNFR